MLKSLDRPRHLLLFVRTPLASRFHREISIRPTTFFVALRWAAGRTFEVYIGSGRSNMRSLIYSSTSLTYLVTAGTSSLVRYI